MPSGNPGRKPWGKSRLENLLRDCFRPIRTAFTSSLQFVSTNLGTVFIPIRRCAT
jgi:hypothetical protein